MVVIPLLYVAVLLGALLQCVSGFWSDFEVNSVENMNGTSSLPVIFGLRAKRIKKGLYGVSGTVTITDAFDGYEADVTYYHSANGGTDWRLAPIKLQRGPLCDKANEEYRKFLMDDLHALSDLPYTEDATTMMCPLFELREYELKNFIFDRTKLPEFLIAGLYKVHILIYKSATVTSGVEVLVTLI